MEERRQEEEAKVRLRRIEGQVRGLQRMLAEGRVCEEVLTQLMAVRSGLDQVGLLLIEMHLERCLLSDLPVEGAKLQELREALRLWTRFGPLTSEPLPVDRS
jgi:DNA-binding FrmR family transcriptional regulator